MKLAKLRKAFQQAYGYALCDSEIIRGRGSKPQDKVRVADIKSWRIRPEMVFDMVEIILVDDQQVVWLDKYDDLTGILRRVAPSKELPMS